MEYDPTKVALYYPETRPHHGLYSAGDNWSLDAVCAEFSRLAYIRYDDGDEPTLAAAMAKAGFGAPECFYERPGAKPRTVWRRIVDLWHGRRWLDAEAFGAVAPDGTIIVAFRGTQKDRLMDLIADARALLKRWSGEGRVHDGFLATYESIRRQIDAWIGDLPKGPLVVTGHSLGAAMATLMAARYPDSTLVTFGSPRVGDADFVAQFAQRTVRRYVDCVDVVADVPPPPIGYAHIGEMHYVDRWGVVQFPPPPDAVRRRDERRARWRYLVKLARRRGNVRTRLLADHAPINYLSGVLGVRTGP